ncbi:MAG: Zn-ribbon domain-containing OB-fold protein [Acidimicrobiia bacterium]
MSTLPAPEPWVHQEAKPYWDAAAEGRLVLPRCTDCGTVIWYPRGFCPSCASFDVEWVELPGTGSVYSFSIARRGQGAYAEAAPYVLAYVELDLPEGAVEQVGPRVITNIVECDPWSVSVGDRVEAVFHPTERGVALVRFRPA